MKHFSGYEAFCKYAENKQFALVGIGVSNLPLISFLYGAGAKRVTARDLKKKWDDPAVLTAEKDGATIKLGENYLSDLVEDVIIRSPGIRPDIPAFSEAEKGGARITCETELFLQFCPCTTIAVTGSDGKTTTTTLISKILEADGKCVHLGGNIGKAMLPQLIEIQSESCFTVSELSSFQLMNCRFSPDIAVITNLSENHLDWHTDMAEYLTSKKNILRYQKKTSRAILNLDNSDTRSLNGIGETLHFSYRKIPKNDGVFFSNGSIFSKKGKNISKILNTDSILLPGKHNVENYMAAIAAVIDLVSCDAICHVAESFGGVEHRIEFVREKDGVKYYNSSIDSSPARSTACLTSFDEKIIMIAGGYDKNLDYSSLGSVICEHVKALILCGATSEKIRNAVLEAKNYKADQPAIYHCSTFEETVSLAEKISGLGDKVVLSPASASFDLFSNFEERGRTFKKLVMEL